MKKNICFIGIGNMGSSLVDLFINKKIWDINHIILCDYESKKLDKYRKIKHLLLFEDASKAIQHSKNIIIAVKPQDASLLFNQLKGNLYSDSLIISIMAGISISTIQKLTGCISIIRAMPNLPIALGKGLIGWSCSEQVPKKQKLLFHKICHYLGKDIYFYDESYLDIITALSGSGPMYIALFIDSLIKAGKSLGLTEDQAKIATLQTIIGSTLMLEQLSISPEQFIQKITSKGGTTEQASKIFTQYDFTNIIIKAIKAAYNKALSLSQLYKQEIN